MNFSIISAIDSCNGIGKYNKLPFNLKSDLEYFKKTTINSVVIMGRKTFESLNYKPLVNRYNVVISNNNFIDDIRYKNINICKNLEHALDMLKCNNNIMKIFVIGGEQLYNEAILSPYCEKLYITNINYDFECDRFFPKIDESKFILKENSEDYYYNYNNNNIKYKFLIYEYKI